MFRVCLNIALLLLVFSIKGQHYFYGNTQRLYSLEAIAYQSGNNAHSITKPYNFHVENKCSFSDSIFQLGVFGYGSDTNSSRAVILPVFDIDFQLSPTTNNTYLSSGFGVQCELNFHPKVSFFSRYSYRSGQASEYILASINNRGTIQGLGFLEDSSNQFKIHELDLNLSAALNDYFLVSIGRGKNFWGDGHRSLLLSDFAPSYPYLRIESEFWKVKYINLYSVHRDHFYSSDKQNKFSSSHLLSWNIIDGLNLSVFESVVWSGKDSLNRRNFDVNYLNPIIFFRPVEYNIGSADNSFLGMNLKATIFKKHVLYSQLILDEFLLEEIRASQGWWANKYGFQLGYKCFDIFKLKGLGVQLEYNRVRPFTYSHVSSLQNYGNANQSLAHPLESNFSEILTRLLFQKDNFSCQLTYAYQQHGGNTFGNYGGDMFSSYSTRMGDYNHSVLQGDLIQQHYLGLNLSYLLIAKSNTAFFSRLDFRNYLTLQKENNLLFSMGIRSNIWNTYLDY